MNLARDAKIFMCSACFEIRMRVLPKRECEL
jgi:hypothetical protein